VKDYDNESRYYSLLVSTYDTTKAKRICTPSLPDVASTPGMEVETEANDKRRSLYHDARIFKP
jgi:hypothetical protein